MINRAGAADEVMTELDNSCDPQVTSNGDFEYGGIPSVRFNLSDTSFRVAETTAVFLCNSSNPHRFHARPTHDLALWIEIVIVNSTDRCAAVPDLIVDANRLVTDVLEVNDSDTPAIRGLPRSSRGTNFDLYRLIWFSETFEALNVGYGRRSIRMLPTLFDNMQAEWQREFSLRRDADRGESVRYAFAMKRMLCQGTQTICYPAGYTKRKTDRLNGGARITLIPRPFALDNIYPACQRESLNANEAISLWYCLPLEGPSDFYLDNDLYNFVTHLRFDFPCLERSKINLFVVAPARFKLENFTPTFRYYPSYGVVPHGWESKNGEPLQWFCAVEGSSSGYGLSLCQGQSILVNCHYKDEVSPRRVVNRRFVAAVIWGLLSGMLSKLVNADIAATAVIFSALAVIVYGGLWFVTGFYWARFKEAKSITQAIVSRVKHDTQECYRTFWGKKKV